LRITCNIEWRFVAGLSEQNALERYRVGHN
jgi:hypothetical protein